MALAGGVRPFFCLFSAIVRTSIRVYPVLVVDLAAGGVLSWTYHG
jgi:hypothetical protein